MTAWGNHTEVINDLYISKSLLIFKATTLGLILCLNLFANSLVLVVLPRIRELSPVTRVFMTSMTVSDLGAGLGYIFPVFASTIVNQWPFGDTMCSILAHTNYVFCLTSSLSLLSVNVERYIAVTRPLRYPMLMNVTRARVISVALWVCSLMLPALSCFVPWRKIYYADNMHACTTGPADPALQDKQGTMFITLFIVGPLGITLALFIRLFRLARWHASRIAALGQAFGRANNKSDKKVFVTFFIMTICLTIAWCPIAIAFIYENVTRTSISGWLMCLAQLMVFSNTVVNVLVYYLRNREFKDTVRKLLKCSCECNMNDRIQETPVISMSTSIS